MPREESAVLPSALGAFLAVGIPLYALAIASAFFEKTLDKKVDFFL